MVVSNLRAKGGPGKRLDKARKSGSMKMLMADKALLQKYTNVLHQVGLANVAISVDLLACAKAFANQIHLTTEAGNKTGIIHLGAQSTSISVLKAGQVIFTRSMLNDPRKDLAEHTVSEAGRSFTYFLEQSGEGSISRVLLSGGPAGDPACFDHFSKHLGIPVEQGNPLVDIDLSAHWKRKRSGSSISWLWRSAWVSSVFKPITFPG